MKSNHSRINANPLKQHRPLTMPSLMRIINSIDTSKRDGRQLFYNICYNIISKILSRSTAIETIKTIVSIIIETEKTIFNRSQVLNYIRNFLIINSDGHNLQCIINLKLLDYILNKYTIEEEEYDHH
uniref:Uncharacterized protein n=1 Tax=Chrysodeixis includens nucleopolyhedrovirus TaxID=1207438 RepID=A0A6B9CJ87_9ABAC|nr:hypothetical protein [Chrysodeixis includens nucleopolyhedrovirus]QGW49952.1 hypothetical protein [Chrysodeixis includens nucleopolyhedrovirus]